MPRRKVEVGRIIGDGRAHARIFAQRKQGLTKKARELATLCGVDVAVVVSAAGPGGGGGAPVVWASKERVIERYRALPAKQRAEHTHLKYAEGELGKEKAKLARVRQVGPDALKSRGEKALDGMSEEELLASIDAALLATAERRKELGMPADDATADDCLRLGQSVPCIGGDDFDDMDGAWDEELMWDGVQPQPLNAGMIQPAPGVQYINGDSVGMGGYQYQPQVPSNGDIDHGRFSCHAYQPNAIVLSGCGGGFQSTDSNYVDTQMLVPGNGNAHDGWFSLSMWTPEESSNSAVPAGYPSLSLGIAGNSVYVPTEQSALGVGDNFTGAPAIGMDEYQMQCSVGDFQFPYSSQHSGLDHLHYLSDVAEGMSY